MTIGIYVPDAMLSALAIGDSAHPGEETVLGVKPSYEKNYTFNLYLSSGEAITGMEIWQQNNGRAVTGVRFVTNQRMSALYRKDRGILERSIKYQLPQVDSFLTAPPT